MSCDFYLWIYPRVLVRICVQIVRHSTGISIELLNQDRLHWQLSAQRKVQPASFKQFRELSSSRITTVAPWFSFFDIEIVAAKCWWWTLLFMIKSVSVFNRKEVWNTMWYAHEQLSFLTEIFENGIAPNFGVRETTQQNTRSLCVSFQSRVTRVFRPLLKKELIT